MPSAFDWLKAHKRTIRERKGLKLTSRVKTIVWIIFILFLLLILRYAGNIMYPFLWAVITTYLFAPLIFFLETKGRLPRVIWIILLYIILGFFIYWGLSFIIPVARTELSELVGVPTQAQPGFLSRLISHSGKADILGYTVNFKETIFEFQQWLRDQARIVALPVLFGTIEYSLLTLLYIVFTFYLLLDGEKYVRFFLILIPAKFRKEVTDVARDINETAGAYIRGLALLIFIMGFFAWTALTVLKVNYAISLSIATGILEIIPVIGPIIATILVALVALNQPVIAYGLTNVQLALILIVIYFTLRQIEDYLIIPNIVGKFIHVHPIMIIFAVLIGAKAGGILGMFLALPVAAAVKILFYYFYPKLA